MWRVPLLHLAQDLFCPHYLTCHQTAHHLLHTTNLGFHVTEFLCTPFSLFAQEATIWTLYACWELLLRSVLLSRLSANHCWSTNSWSLSLSVQHYLQRCLWVLSPIRKETSYSDRRFWVSYVLFIIIIGGILILFINIYNKTSIKRNILTIKQNTSGSRSG